MSTSVLSKDPNLTDQERLDAIKFDSTDFGRIIMSIGMAIGAGIVFLPVPVGLLSVDALYLIMLVICRITR